MHKTAGTARTYIQCSSLSRKTWHLPMSSVEDVKCKQNNGEQDAETGQSSEHVLQGRAHLDHSLHCLNAIHWSNALRGVGREGEREGAEKKREREGEREGEIERGRERGGRDGGRVRGLDLERGGEREGERDRGSE